MKINLKWNAFFKKFKRHSLKFPIKINFQFGMTPRVVFPYDKLKYKGEKLFEDGKSYDGGKVLCLFMGESDKIVLEE